MSSKYRMSKDGEIASDSSSSTGGLSSGCYVSLVHGFILLLLAVAIAVGVGIIVLFAGGRQVVCHCGESDPIVGTTSAPSTMSPEAVRQMCIDIIMEGDGQEICEACTAVPGVNTTVAPTTSATTTAPAPTDYRLPITVRPYLYTVELQPNIYGGENGIFDFEGSVKIQVYAEKASRTIVLHAHPTLNITRDTVKVSNLNTTDAVEFTTSYEELREFYTLHLATDLSIGHHYVIEMAFRGPLTQSGVGLYLAYYEEDGQRIYLATTQFEAPHARKAFPCFDEPALKAQFDIILIRQESGARNYISLSNTPQIRNETLGNGMIRDIYERTVVMPTYLLAFIVCDYKYMEDNVTNVMYRTWAMPERIEYTETAQRHGIEIFKRFASYFEPEYVFSKLDNIAIPDFTAGAMENWGLITYRDTLLYEPGVSSSSNEDWIAIVISHEVAHQWFGNLVSPQWWNWLWLNEAFASFWDYHIVGEIYPHWRELEMTVVGAVHQAFSSDSLRTSHPLTADVMTPSEISAIFDTITYSKGSAIVKMMHLAMGQTMFINGLNRYLDAQKFGNAVHQDLWDALSEVSGNLLQTNRFPETYRKAMGMFEESSMNMTEIMDPWVTQMNFPVVNVAIDRDLGKITLTQNRFLLSGAENASQDIGTYGYKWTIPITYTTSNNSNFTTEYIYSNVHHFKYHEPSLVLDVTIPPDGWIIVNLQQYGFYRVNYDEQNWNNIVDYLQSDSLEEIHSINRAQIINDAWNLAKAGLLSQDIALKTVNHLSKDLDYVPWRAFIRELGYVENMLERTSLFGMFEDFIKKSVDIPYTTLGTNMTEEMPPVEKIEKAQIVSLACEYDYQPCVDAALEEFSKWTDVSSNFTIYPDLRDTYYCTAVRHGGLTEWTLVYERYHQAVDSSEKSRLRKALACSREPWLLQRVLEMSLNADEIRPQDTRDTITTVANSRWGRELAWNFVTHHFDHLAETIQALSGISRLIQDMTSKYNTAQEYNKVKDFMDNRDVSAAGSAFNQVLEKTRTNIDWLEDNFDVFRSWLESETRL